MVNSSIILTVFSVVVEYCYIYPIYYLIGTGLESSYIFSPGPGVALLIGVALLNIWLIAGRNYRLLPVWLINLGLGALTLAYFGGPVIISTAQGVKVIIAYWLFFITMVWLWHRAARLVHGNINFSKAVSRFELSMTLMFITFWISAFTIPVPGALLWLLAAFLSNAVALAQTQNGLKGPANWWGPALAALVLIPLALIITLIFPWLYAPAQYIFGSAQPLLAGLGQILLVPLLWIVKIAHLAPTKSVMEDNVPANSSEQFNFLDVAIPGASPLSQILVSAALILFVLALLLKVIYLFYNLLKKFWRRQSPGYHQQAYSLEPSTWWQTVLTRVLLVADSLRLVLLTWLPGGIKVNQAYRALQLWGRYRNYPRHNHETPYEYYQRLVEIFPLQQPNLRIIIDQFVCYQYGGKVIEPRLAREIKVSVRNLFFSRFRHFKRNNEKNVE